MPRKVGLPSTFPTAWGGVYQGLRDFFSDRQVHKEQQLKQWEAIQDNLHKQKMLKETQDRTKLQKVQVDHQIKMGDFANDLKTLKQIKTPAQVVTYAQARLSELEPGKAPSLHAKWTAILNDGNIAIEEMDKAQKDVVKLTQENRLSVAGLTAIKAKYTHPAAIELIDESLEIQGEIEKAERGRSTTRLPYDEDKGKQIDDTISFYKAQGRHMLDEMGYVKKGYEQQYSALADRMASDIELVHQRRAPTWLTGQGRTPPPARTTSSGDTVGNVPPTQPQQPPGILNQPWQGSGKYKDASGTIHHIQSEEEWNQINGGG